MSHSTQQIKRLVLLATALAPIAFLTGCSMTGTAPPTNSFSPAATISGSLHGGNQPISGAIISLYGAGNTGYGSPATLFATTASNNDASGSFSFSQVALPAGNTTGVIDSTQNVYACPASNPQIYITSKGGTTEGSGNPSNAAAGFIIALGQCSTVASSFVDLNEVTTVATLAALQQYFNPNTEGLGYNGTTQSALGFANGIATISNLVSTVNGSANATFTPTSTLAGATVTATPEQSKINTIANILASCVNSNNTIVAQSTSCNTLFTNAVPPASSTQTSQPGLTFSAATDTLQAAYFMLINPTESQDNGATAGKMFNLYGLAGGVGAPFQPSLSAQPTDWTIGVTYASASSPTTSVPVLSFPKNLAVDANGNVWVANDVTPTSTTSNIGASLVELSPTGGVTQQVLTTGQLFGPGELAIDPAGNVWVPNFGTTSTTSPYGYQKTVVEFPASGTPATGKVFNVAGGPFGVASDGAGNIFVGEATVVKTNTGGGNGTPGADVEEIPAGSPTTTPPTVISSASVSPGYSADQFSAIGVDSQYNVYVTSDATNVFAFIPTASGSGSATTYAYNSGLVGTAGTEIASLAIDNANHAWIADFKTPFDLFNFSITGGTLAPSATYSGGGLSFISLSVVDGAGNIWVSNNTTTNEASEFTNAGVAISPTAGFVHTTDDPVGIAVDPTGNVWLGGSAASTHAATAGKVAAGGYITEIVGAAVPVVTPIAAGLPAVAGAPSTSTIGTKP